MLKRIYITFISLILVYWTPHDFATLPRWVHRVDSCPDLNNMSLWVEASHRLNCYHDLTSTDPFEQAAVYHCLPSSFLNETVEFCGKNVPVAPGNCPVYNYQNGKNIAASYYKCSAFMSGCPSQMFHSKNVRQHPECLRINRKEKCFEVQVNCSTNASQENVIEIIPPGQTSTMTIDSMDMIKMKEEEGNTKIVYITLLTFGAIILLIVVGGCVLYKRNHRLCRYFFKKVAESKYLKRNLMSAQELQDLSNRDENKQQNGNSVCASDDSGCVENEMHTEETISGSDDSGIAGQHVEEQKALLPDWCQAAINWSFNDFIETLRKKMTPAVVDRIKRRLYDRKENNQPDIDAIHNTDDLLNYLSKKYLVFNNVVFLQGLFLACKAPKLYDVCVEYAKTREKEIMYFEQRILEEDHTKIKFVINCPHLPSYKRAELEKLRAMLSTLLRAQYDDILVCGVKEGCVIVTFMIRNCLIPSLKDLYSSEKQNMVCQWMLKLQFKFKIMKVVIEDDVVYMSDLLSTGEELRAEAKLCQDPTRLKSHGGELETKTSDSINHYSLESSETKEQGCLTTGALEEDQNQELQRMKDFFEMSLCSMTDDTLDFIKTCVQDFMDEKSVRNMDRTTLLNKLTDTLKLQYNMGYLEWILGKCGEEKLLDRYLKFASANTCMLKPFQAAVVPGPEHQTLELYIMVPELEKYSDEMLHLRCWVAEISRVHPNKILMTALKTRPIIVSYILRKKHCGTFLKFVESDEGQIAASRNRVEKIIHDGKVLNIAKALNGTSFVHVRLRYEKSQSKGSRKKITNAASLIGRTLGIKMEGREVYMRTVQPENSNHDYKGESQIFIENNRSSLLKNLELSVLLANHEIVSLFDEENISKMESFNSRRDKIDHFLKMCEKLPDTAFEQMVLPHLRESISSSKTSSKEFNSLKNWVEENRETILDEMDADIIETTVNNMEDVPDEVKDSWSDGSKRRKDRCNIFLDFVLQKDDYLKALKKTMEENGIQCDNH